MQSSRELSDTFLQKRQFPMQLGNALIIFICPYEQCAKKRLALARR
jgi:hypothetical protein